LLLEKIQRKNSLNLLLVAWKFYPNLSPMNFIGLFFHLIEIFLKNFWEMGFLDLAYFAYF
jgi:hypothetical protein